MFSKQPTSSSERQRKHLSKAHPWALLGGAERRAWGPPGERFFTREGKKFGGMFDHNPALVRDVVETPGIFLLVRGIIYRL